MTSRRERKKNVGIRNEIEKGEVKHQDEEGKEEKEDGRRGEEKKKM